MPANPYASLMFPAAGLVKRYSFENRPPYSTPAASNVRPDDEIAERARGGSRPGLTKMSVSAVDFSAISGANVPQMLTDMLYVNSGTLTNIVLAVANGTLYKLGTTTWSAATNTNSPRSDIPLSCIDYRQILYIAGDNTSGSGGHKLLSYDPSTNAVALAVKSTTAAIPTNCRMVARHNDRLWLMVDEYNPHEWYASAVGDALNYDFSAATVGAAISGADADAGQIGEPITTGFSHSNLCFIFGCDSSLWIMRGDPAVGGTISNLSRRIGILDRFSWCHDPSGALWFISRDGLYMLPPGCGTGAAPTQISRDKIPLELVHIDPTLFQVTMGYDIQHQGIHIYVTPYSSGTSTTHWWFSTKTQSFWPVSIAAARAPFILCPRRSYTPNLITESNVWHASRDGVVRRYDEAATQDDNSVNITSYVDFGPFPLGPPGYDGILSEIQLVNSSGTSGTITADVRVGENGEAAFNASAFQSHTLSTAGLNYTWRPMARGHAAVVRINGTGEWGFEELLVKRIPAGPRRVI